MRLEPQERGRMRVDLAPAPASATRRGDHVLIPAIGSDGGLFPIDKLKAHLDGVFHLAVSVFVFHGDRLLIQRRAPGKYHCAGLWANTCCTHPNWGEDLAASATRRLREELGFDAGLRPGAVVDYSAAVSRTMREHERVQVFWARFPSNAPPPSFRPNPDEADAALWAELDLIQRVRRSRPDLFAPWFRIYLDRWSELGIDGVVRSAPAL